MTTTLHAVGNWIFRFFGFSGTGSHYGAWSGSLSDLGEVAIFGGAATLVRHHNCHEKGCWRLGRHPIGRNGLYRVCHRHHPGVAGRSVSHARIAAAHAEHLADHAPSPDPQSVTR